MFNASNYSGKSLMAKAVILTVVVILSISAIAIADCSMGYFNILDISSLMAYLFQGGSDPGWGLEAVDGYEGTNLSDLTYLNNYLQYGGQAPYCHTAFGSVLPVSDDTLFIVNDTISPASAGHLVDLWFKPSNEIHAFSIILQYDSPLEFLTIEEFNFDESLCAGWRREYSVDAENHKIFISGFRDNAVDPVITGPGLIGSIYFAGTFSMVPQYISFDTTTYDPEHINLISIDGTDPVVPEIVYTTNYDNILICGDINGDGVVNIIDITTLIDHLYIHPGGEIPLNIGDVNSDYAINIIDITYLINFLYNGGPEPNCPMI